MKHNTWSKLKSRIYRLCWLFQVKLLSTVIFHFRLTYVDVTQPEVRNAEEKKDFDLSLNGDIFQWYGAFVIHIGPLQLTCCRHILINPLGSWTSSLRLALTNNFVVLDDFDIKFDSNILLGIKDSYLKCIITFSSSKFAKLKYEQPLFMVSQSTLKFAWSLWFNIKCNFNLPLPRCSKIPVVRSYFK